MHGELASGTRPTGRPALRYKDVCKLGQAQRRPPVLSLIGVGVTVDEDGRERNGTLAGSLSLHTYLAGATP